MPIAKINLSSDTFLDFFIAFSKLETDKLPHPSKLEIFVLEPENSRAIPGNEQVSIRYGVRHAKFVLLKSKREIADEFKIIYPDCEFSTSTLIREFPPYAVTATSRDLDRNTCPIHANVRHLVRAINRIFKRENLDQLPVLTLFEFYGFPLPLVGLDGSPVRAVGILQ